MVEQVSKEIREKLQARARDGKLSCAAAHKFAQEQGISLESLGKIIAELEIKIVECQLGCFSGSKRH